MKNPLIIVENITILKIKNPFSIKKKKCDDMMKFSVSLEGRCVDIFLF